MCSKKILKASKHNVFEVINIEVHRVNLRLQAINSVVIFKFLSADSIKKVILSAGSLSLMVLVNSYKQQTAKLAGSPI